MLIANRRIISYIRKPRVVVYAEFGDKLEEIRRTPCVNGGYVIIAKNLTTNEIITCLEECVTETTELLSASKEKTLVASGQFKKIEFTEPMTNFAKMVKKETDKIKNKSSQTKLF